MQGGMAVDVPPVLVGDSQGHIIAIHYLNFAHMETIRREGDRQRQEVDLGFPEQYPGRDRCQQQDCGYLYSALVDFYIHE